MDAEINLNINDDKFKEFLKEFNTFNDLAKNVDLGTKITSAVKDALKGQKELNSATQQYLNLQKQLANEQLRMASANNRLNLAFKTYRNSPRGEFDDAKFDTAFNTHRLAENRINNVNNKYQSAQQKFKASQGNFASAQEKALNSGSPEEAYRMKSADKAYAASKKVFERKKREKEKQRKEESKADEKIRKTREEARKKEEKSAQDFLYAINNLGGPVIKMAETMLGFEGAMKFAKLMGDLSSAGATSQQTARRLSLAPGQAEAFSANMKRFGLGDEFLASTARNKADLTMGGVFSQLGIQDQNKADTAQLALEEVRKIHEFMNSPEHKNITETEYNSRHLNRTGIDFLSATQIGNTPTAELNQQLKAATDISKFAANNDALTKWQTLNTNLDIAGKSIEKNLIEGLAPLAPILGRLTLDFVGLLDKLEKSSWFQTKVKNFTRGLGGIANVLEGKGLNTAQDLVDYMKDQGKTVTLDQASKALKAHGNDYSGAATALMEAALIGRATMMAGPIGGLATAAVLTAGYSFDSSGSPNKGKSPTPSTASAIAKSNLTSSGNINSIGDLLGKSEGTGNNYNDSLAHGAFTGGQQDLSKMTLNQVAQLQKSMLANPANRFNSSAIGRYQFVRSTLLPLAAKLNISGDTKFDSATQDKLLTGQLNSIGLQDYLSGKITADQFQTRMAGTWDSIPDPRTGLTYAGPGRHPHRPGVSMEQTQALLASLKNSTPANNLGEAQNISKQSSGMSSYDMWKEARIAQHTKNSDKEASMIEDDLKNHTHNFKAYLVKLRKETDEKHGIAFDGTSGNSAAKPSKMSANGSGSNVKITIHNTTGSDVHQSINSLAT